MVGIGWLGCHSCHRGGMNVVFFCRFVLCVGCELLFLNGIRTLKGDEFNKNELISTI